MAREIISTGNDLAAIASVDAGCEFFYTYFEFLLAYLSLF